MTLMPRSPDDTITVTIGGVTHAFPADRFRADRTVSVTRDGEVYRYLAVTVRLGDEFPETTQHMKEDRT